MTKRPVGRRHTRWRDYVAQIGNERLGIPLAEIELVVQDPDH